MAVRNYTPQQLAAWQFSHVQDYPPGYDAGGRINYGGPLTGGNQSNMQNFQRFPMSGSNLTVPGLGTAGASAPAGQQINDPLNSYGQSAGGINYRLPFIPPPSPPQGVDFEQNINSEMLDIFRTRYPQSGNHAYSKLSDEAALARMWTNEHEWMSEGKESPWREPAIKNLLGQQTQEQTEEAKYWNEYRYAQGLDFLEQRLGNIMGQLEGLGDEEKREVRESFEALQGKLEQRSIGSGLTGTTVRGAQMAGLTREKERALGTARERIMKQKLGYEAILTSDIVNFIKERSDVYPSVTDMANLYFGYGQSGGGQASPEAGNTGGAAAAGIGAGLALAFICCWIFLEARYGNGTMDRVVRRFRDENMTARNRRGYYKMAEVLVPLMRKHWWVKAAVRLGMTSPLVCYGKWYYREGGLWGRLGWVFAPVKSAWLKTWDFLGGDFEFLRANGEVV
jgi:hypothetical protein